jgi:RimJ/RimL family protein N-acetyltransferase
MSSASRAQPHSARLTYRELTADALPVFHDLAVDPHVRRFLLDGQIVSRDWAALAVEKSERSIRSDRLGLWLLFERGVEDAVPIGFAGYWTFDELGPELQLIYAFREAHAHHGFATEAASAVICFAREHAGMDEISATVDEPNVASIHVLDKLGFEACGDTPGAFGRILRYRLPAGRALRQFRTERLLLRPPWRDNDIAAFAVMNADPQVMEFFPATLSTEQSAALAARIRRDFDDRGHGLWVVEAPTRASFIGICGLARPTFEATFTPCVEIGWRLAAEHWGHGYATEAARAVLHAAFVHVGLAEVVSFTAVSNRRSRRVMEKLGMRRDPAEDFDHPSLPGGHPLRRHVLHRLRREEWHG